MLKIDTGEAIESSINSVGKTASIEKDEMKS